MVKLPRLAYVGEVPVRAISAGPALLYRLLENYPRDRLLVLESNHNPRQPDRELPGVETRQFPLVPSRLLRTRFSAWVSAWTYLNAARHGRALGKQLRCFGAEAILSVTHGYGSLAAAAAAQTTGVSLHLLAHDDWGTTLTAPAGLRARAEREFGEIYRRAATRLPISPAMEEHYSAAYGASGTVIYPSQPSDAALPEHPPLRPPVPGRFIFAYAGSAHSIGQRTTLADFANAIAPLGARLRIYQGIAPASLKQAGLRTDNVDFMPFLPHQELHRSLSESVDAMYLPMSFAPEDESNVKLCFPSKLSDYTVVGLPILVRSPAHGTAARWARENAEAALLVTRPEAGAIREAAGAIITEPLVRKRLATAALEVGKRMFGHDAVTARFHAMLRSTHTKN